MTDKIKEYAEKHNLDPILLNMVYRFWIQLAINDLINKKTTKVENDK